MAMVMRKPSVCTNFIPVGYAHTWNATRHADLFIPKRLWKTLEQRFLSLRETVEIGAASFLFANQFRDAGLGIAENSADEILEVVEEMDQRLEGRWITTEEDEYLQRRFWSILKGESFCWTSRIGSGFLRRHPEYLT